MPAAVELGILHFLQGIALSSPISIALAVFAARWLIFLDLIFLPILWQRGKTARHIIKELLWAGGVSVLCTTAISQLVARPRPFMLASNDITRIIPEPFNTSFPSGHTGVAFVIAAILLSYDSRLGAMAFGIALIVALGRMAVGVHYPTDILGGMFVAMIVFFGVKYVHRKLWGHRQPV